MAHISRLATGSSSDIRSSEKTRLSLLQVIIGRQLGRLASTGGQCACLGHRFGFESTEGGRRRHQRSLPEAHIKRNTGANINQANGGANLLPNNRPYISLHWPSILILPLLILFLTAPLMQSYGAHTSAGHSMDPKAHDSLAAHLLGQRPAALGPSQQWLHSLTSGAKSEAHSGVATVTGDGLQPDAAKRVEIGSDMSPRASLMLPATMDTSINGANNNQRSLSPATNTEPTSIGATYQWLAFRRATSVPPDATGSHWAPGETNAHRKSMGNPTSQANSSSVAQTFDARLARLLAKYTDRIPEERTSLPAQSNKHLKRLLEGGEIDKLLKVLWVAARASRKLDPAATRPTEPALPPSPQLRSQQLERRESATATATSKLAASSTKALSRLVKKADWNALFVKLTKVFVQYFLDLVLSDMFGTKAEAGNRRWSVSTEIDMRKTMRDFLRVAWGLEPAASK